MTCERQTGQFPCDVLILCAQTWQKRLWPQGTRAAQTSRLRQTVQERVALLWGRRGECFGETAAVPSLELDSQEPVGLGGWCWEWGRGKEPRTLLKSKTRSKATGADIGVGARCPIEAAICCSCASWLRLFEPNTALERGLQRAGLLSVPQVFNSTPSSGVLRVRVLGGLLLSRGNWKSFSETLRVRR